MTKVRIGYDEALARTFEAITPLGQVTVPVFEAVDRVAAMEQRARVSSPSVNASQKDGFAVCSEDLDAASPERPVMLRIIGAAAAGGDCDLTVTPGTAVRILTGARIPRGATAVLAEEFTRAEGADRVHVTNTAEPGRNILERGSDVAEGDRICARGDRLTPGTVGLLAAAGYGEATVYQTPRVTIVATGDEVVAPGHPLPDGKLYASNLVTLSAWCRRYGMAPRVELVADQPDLIRTTLKRAVESSDAVLTSGGAWTGDRDYVARMLDELGWEPQFHRVRMGPGKAVGLGLLHGTPVFILPGGPPSNLLAFLEIALPGLLALAGDARPSLPEVQVHLEQTVTVRDVDWTQFLFGALVPGQGVTRFRPLRLKSRLQSMARAQAVMAVPEGVLRVDVDTVVTAQLLQ